MIMLCRICYEQKVQKTLRLRDNAAGSWEKRLVMNMIRHLKIIKETFLFQTPVHPNVEDTRMKQFKTFCANPVYLKWMCLVST